MTPSLKDRLAAGEFVITCEIVPGRGTEGPPVDAARVFAERAVAEGLPIHAISITDNPGGSRAISPDAIAREVQGAGVEPLVHFSCRDLNRNAIESRASALSRNGIHNLLILTGDNPESAAEGRARGVFDLDSVQALRYLKEMNAGRVPGRKPDTTDEIPPTRFFLGAVVSPFKSREEELVPQFLKLEKKVAAGADFIIPQLGYDMRKFHEIGRYLKARDLDVPLLGNVYVLTRGAARAMNKGLVPGCEVSDHLLKRLEEEFKTPGKGLAQRLERAARMVAVFKGMGWNGVHLGGFGLKFEHVARILELADAFAPDWERFIPDLRFNRPGEFYLFPKPSSYRPDAPVDPDPLPALKGEGAGATYAVWSAMHRVLFDERSPMYKMLRGYYRRLDDKSMLYRFSHGGELTAKRLFFKCQDCGDCVLAEMAYCCPRGQCPKNQRNGPCGGSHDGSCEVYPDRPCVWTQVYRRLKSKGELEAYRDKYVPPRDAALEHTSGWANFFGERDTSARIRTATALEKKSGETEGKEVESGDTNSLKSTTKKEEELPHGEK